MKLLFVFGHREERRGELTFMLGFIRIYVINLVWSPLYKKWRFPLKISSLIVIKSAVLRIWSHLLKKSLMQTYFVCAVRLL